MNEKIKPVEPEKSFDEQSEKFALEDYLVNATAGVDPHFWGPGYDE